MKLLAKDDSFAKMLGKTVIFTLMIVTAVCSSVAYAAPVELGETPNARSEGNLDSEPKEQTPTENPQLQIVKKADKQVIGPRESSSIETWITNTGTMRFDGVVADQLSGVDQGLFSVKNVHGGQGLTTYDPTIQQVKWVGGLDAGESVAIDYDIEADYSAKNGDHVVSSIVTPSETTVDCSGCIVAIKVTAPLLHISVTADHQTAAPGQTIYYTATVKNVGEQDYAQDIYSKLNRAVGATSCWGCLGEAPAHYNSDVRASLPGEVYYGGNYFWWWGRIPAGQTLTLSYSAQINDQVTEGDRLIAALSSTCCIDTETPSNIAVVDITIPQKPELHFEMVANKQTATIGDRVSYRVTVQNVGQKNYQGALSIDLKGVLDKADYNYDAFSSGGGIFSFDAYDGLRWQGAVASGRTVVLNYSVSVQTSAVAGSRMIGTIKPPEDTSVSGALPTSMVTIAPPPDNGNYHPGQQCRTIIRVVVEWPFKLVWEKETVCDGRVIERGAGPWFR